MKAGLTIVVGGVERPICGCCLAAPAEGAWSPPFGRVCLDCFQGLRNAAEALQKVGLVACRALGPDHQEGGLP